MNALEKYLKRLKFTKIIYILLLTKIALIYTKVCLENWDRGGLPLCGVKVSHQVTLSKALQCYAPRIHQNPTTLLAGVVRNGAISIKPKKD